MTGTRRASAVLALGSVVSGLLAYVLFALITRGLGAEAAAPVSVLWTQWAFAGAALHLPAPALDHPHRRRPGDEDVVRRAAPRVAVLVVGAGRRRSACSPGWRARTLFHRADAWFPVMVALVTVGSAVIGVIRGGLGGRGRFEAVAWSLVAENGLRCVLVAALLLAGVRDPVALRPLPGRRAARRRAVALGAALTAARSAASGRRRPLAFLSGAAVGAAGQPDGAHRRPGAARARRRSRRTR